MTLPARLLWGIKLHEFFFKCVTITGASPGFGRALTKNRITFGPISILFCKKRLLKAKK